LLRGYLSLILCLFIFGCSKKEEVTNAVDEALYYLSLSTPDCEAAIDVLQDVDAEDDDYRYVQTLASAYACRADFSELTLFSEIDVLQAGATEFLNSLTKFSMSPETEADSFGYTNLWNGINTIIYSAGQASSDAAARETAYGSRMGGNLNLQTLYMMMIQLGKFLHYYGNVDASGVKGGGAANTDEQGATPSTCIFDYTGDALTYINGNPLTGSCNANADLGHPDLDGGVANLSTTIRRMCEGMVLLNNIVDILNTTSLSSSDSLGELGSVVTDINTAITAAEGAYPQLSTLIDTKDVDACQTYSETGSNFDNLQLYYAVIFETGFI
jgi:hypothetical protein